MMHRTTPHGRDDGVPEATVGEPQRYGDELFHHGRVNEHDRLRNLAAALDPISHTRLSSIDIPRDGHYLDLGAGTGSLAVWLAENFGSTCTVTAVDRDTGFLELNSHPRVAIRQADVTEEAFEPGTFDLVHARFLLLHIRDRDALLMRMAHWLRPGGWLVVSDGANLGTPSSPEASYRRTLDALFAGVAAAIGTDIDFGRHYPRPLADLGLTHIGMAADLPVVSAGSPLAAFWRDTIGHVRQQLLATGAIDADTVEAAVRYLEEPTTWDLSLAVITAWGRRPEVDHVDASR